MHQTTAAAPKRNLSRASLILALIRLGGFLVGFIAIILLAKRFGAGRMTDIFFIAQVFPVLFLRQIVRAINCSFIPVFSEALVTGDERPAWKMASNFTAIFVLGSVIAGLIYFVACRYFVFLLAPGFSSESLDAIVRLTRILTPAFALFALFAVAESILNSKWVFIPPSLAANLPSLGIIIGILFLAPHYGITGVVIGLLAGIFLQTGFILPALRKHIKLFAPSFSFKEAGTRNIFRQFTPILFSSSINQINQVADKSMATLLGIGRVSALTYSSRLIIFLPELFLSSFGRTILPTISEQVALQQHDDIKQMLRDSIRWICFLVLPIVCLIVMLRANIVSLFFERGDFSADDTRLTALALGFYAPSILIVTANICIRRTIFALQESYFIAKVGVVGVGFNVLMNFILMRFLDVGGLACATTLSALLHFSLSYWFLVKKIGPIFTKDLAVSLLKTGASSAVTLLVLMVSSPYVIQFVTPNSVGTKFAHLAVLSSLGGAAYILAALFLKIPELKQAFSIIGLRRWRYDKELAS